jgi:hypothetical protein
MMSPHQIQEILDSSALSENDISKRVIVPCLQKISMRNSYSLRNVRFTGGSYEKGTDIEYYEIMGPDKLRFYTGIQAKKGNLNQSDATQLITQGTQAFEKDITDPSEGRAYRLNRWIVTTTGNISPPAKEEIHKHLDRYGKLISFWDGAKVGEFVLGNFYQEFVNILSVDPRIAGSSSGQAVWWDPDEPQVLVSDFSSLQWSSVVVSEAVPLVSASGIFLTVKPTGGNFPPVKCAVRSSRDELLVESISSQLNPYLLGLEDGETSIEAMLVEGNRPVDLLARGYTFFR